MLVCTIIHEAMWMLLGWQVPTYICLFALLLVQAELSLSQRKMCNELSRLKGEEVEEDVPDTGSSFSAALHVQSLSFYCLVCCSKQHLKLDDVFIFKREIQHRQWNIFRTFMAFYTLSESENGNSREACLSVWSSSLWSSGFPYLE